MNKTKLFLLCFSVPIAVFGTEVTLEDAIQMAYKKNVNVINAEKDLDNYELNKKIAVSSALPQLSYTAYTSILQEDESSSVADSDNVYSHSIDLEQTIYSGGKIKAGIKAADIYTEIAQLNYENVKKSTRLDIIYSYLEILKLEKNLQLYTNSLDELNKNLNKTNEMYKLGIVSKTSVLQLEYQVIDIKSTIMQVKNSIEVSSLLLKNKIGLSEKEDLSLVDFNPEIKNFEDIDFEYESRIGFPNNITAKLAGLNTALQEKNEVIQKAELLPAVDASFSYDSYDYDANPDDWEWTATVEFSVDLWDWKADKNSLEKAKNETEKAKQSEDDTLKSIQLEIRSNYLELSRLTLLLEAKKEALESSTENYNLESERFNEGLTSTTDFLSAQNTLTTSQIDVANSEIDLYYAYQVYLDSLNM